MRIKPLLTGMAILAATALPGSANATLTFFTDRTLWENTLGGTIVTEDFNAVAPFTLGAGSNPAGLLDITLVNVLGPHQPDRRHIGFLEHQRDDRISRRRQWDRRGGHHREPAASGVRLGGRFQYHP